MNIKNLEEYDEATEKAKEAAEVEWRKFMEEFDRVITDMNIEQLDNTQDTQIEVDLSEIDLDEFIEAVNDLNDAIENYDTAYTCSYDTDKYTMVLEEHPVYGGVYSLVEKDTPIASKKPPTWEDSNVFDTVKFKFTGTVTDKYESLNITNASIKPLDKISYDNGIDYTASFESELGAWDNRDSFKKINTDIRGWTESGFTLDTSGWFVSSDEDKNNE